MDSSTTVTLTGALKWVIIQPACFATLLDSLTSTKKAQAPPLGFALGGYSYTIEKANATRRCRGRSGMRFVPTPKDCMIHH